MPPSLTQASASSRLRTTVKPALLVSLMLISAHYVQFIFCGEIEPEIAPSFRHNYILVCILGISPPRFLPNELHVSCYGLLNRTIQVIWQVLSG